MLSHNFFFFFHKSRQCITAQTLIPSCNHFVSGEGKNVASSAFQIHRRSKQRDLQLRHSSHGVRASLVTSSQKPFSVKAVITVIEKVGAALTHSGFSRGLDDTANLLGRTILVELVAADLDPKSGLEKPRVQAYARPIGSDANSTLFEATFEIREDFGEMGAVLVENGHQQEMYVKSIALDGFPSGAIYIKCDSWVQPKSDNPTKRVFFSNKSYLPSQTPSGMKILRDRELEILRGDGQGERKTSDRIYDYDVYNDLGDPDKDEDTARPVIGGPDHPYPRRCRTGRPRTKKDPLSESRSSDIYVPQDEAFSQIKQATFNPKAAYLVVHVLVPLLKTILADPDLGFPFFSTLDTFFDKGVVLPDIPTTGFLGNIVPRQVRPIKDTGNNVLRFETPKFVDRDRLAWLRDAEFARQTLAGINPCSVQLVTEWPLKSKLDPEVYGPPESAITTELVEQDIRGFCTIEEALKQKKLFVLDYHDLLLPFVKRVRELKGRTLYGSRTLFFLMPSGTLRPIAIELTRPKMDDKPQWKHVFNQSCWEPTRIWLWRLAKTHVLAHDSGYHQLISHWLRTHCSTEPYIIATHRQLSAMHPIHRLLYPHLRYTMEINAFARQSLLNAKGIIEDCFSPGKYSVELSSAAYDQLWQFDLQALPADLINRGMAVEDPTAPHGLKLTIEDYPYANDGLLIWDAIKQWVTDYVPHFYPEPDLIQSDTELQAWWTEIRTVGHGDKKDEPWWPVLKTHDDLISILTTIIWIASGHHAAVNFGQFDYGAYFPNRPTVARSPMPIEEPSPEDKKKFMERPETFLLECFPSQIEAATVMAILDVLSNHSPDEEYIGGQAEACWAEDKVIRAAFERFHGKLVEIEGMIDARNVDEKLKNRSGAGVVPYELLKPYSGPGVTGKGVPNSISI